MNVCRVMACASQRGRRAWGFQALDTPRLLQLCAQPGRYELRKPQILLGIYSVNERRIEHGTYERVRLQSGQLVFFQDAEV